MKRTAVVLTLVLLAGCATDQASPELPADHPANAEAATAPLPATPDTLTATAPTSAATQPQSDEHAGHHDHSAALPQVQKQGDAAESVTVYACPMHPEVTSTDANARCAKCGMRLKPREKEEAMTK